MEDEKRPMKTTRFVAFFIIILNLLHICLIYAEETPERYSKLPSGFIPLTDKEDPASGLPLVIRCERDGSEMALVPAGEFIMGSNELGNSEAPQHTVSLDAYYIDRYEITNAQFKRFCDEAGYKYPMNPPWDDNYFLGKPDHPVVLVNWHLAQSYVKWAGKRLPTEAEWEKAARGTDRRLYPWGNEWNPSSCNLATTTDGFEYTSPVGSFEDGESIYGCYDMIGNVWEWCADLHEPNYYKFTEKINPQGPSTGDTRVVRGGSWRDQGNVQCATRGHANPLANNVNDGFRCALTPSYPRSGNH